MADLQTEKILSASQAQLTVEAVMDATHKMLRKVLREEFRAQAGEITRSETDKQYTIFSHFPQPTPDIEQSSLSGFCSHAQSFMTWTLQDMNFSPRCFTFQSEPSPGTPRTGLKSTQNHVALTVQFQTSEGPKTFLLDPTFIQFCQGLENSPGTVLSRQPGGEALVESLRKKGFAEMGPEDAARYVAAFHGGKNPFPSAEDAMAFLNNPNDARLAHGLWPPKSYLMEKGWYPGTANGQTDAPKMKSRNGGYGLNAV